MKFATILREAGFSSKKFEKCSKISINLYDGKDRIDTSEDIHFVKKIFHDNNNSFINFFDFLNFLEELPKQPESIDIKIDEFNVIVFYKTPNAKVFSRKKFIDPMD